MPIDPTKVPRFFSFSNPGGFDWHETLEAARAAAENELQHERDNAPDDGWDEDDALSVCYGEIKGAAFVTHRMPWDEFRRQRGDTEEDIAESPSRFDEFVEFDLRLLEPEEKP